MNEFTPAMTSTLFHAQLIISPPRTELVYGHDQRRHTEENAMGEASAGISLKRLSLSTSGCQAARAALAPRSAALRSETTAVPAQVKLRGSLSSTHKVPILRASPAAHRRKTGCGGRPPHCGLPASKRKHQRIADLHTGLFPCMAWVQEHCFSLRRV
jgi:hypothetical protein